MLLNRWSKYVHSISGGYGCMITIPHLYEITLQIVSLVLISKSLASDHNS